ncbi:MAG TPA: OmpH family outer membrane protein [Candidatus Aminicenantes bacterium]|nr:OmpH family outer membrane protein [Candidatus Aminicenantes bacterium]HDT12830.1 OmpH family outer membrane protein [Candidatus Aminicenantes bacterium]
MRHPVRLVALIAAAAACLSGPALAQEGTKLGLIDSSQVLERSAEGKRAIAQLQAADKKYSDDIARLDEQIKQLQNRLSTQRLTLTAEAATGLQLDIQKKQTDRQRAIEDASRDIQDLQVKTLNRIQEDLIPLIEKLREDKGLDIIFDLAKPGTVYFDPAIDLTEELIRRYDAMKAAPPAKK